MNEGTELVEAYDYLFKVIIIGESGTGKSCLLHQFIHDSFKDNSPHTIGVEFNSKVIRIADKSVKLQLWDTAGQERFRSVTRSYYRGAAAAILVYDITQRQSFQNLDKWLADCRAIASPHLVVVLVGNKVDMESRREVDYLEGMRWAEHNNVTFIETSSLKGTNAGQPFLLLAQSIILLMEEGVIDPDEPGTGVSFGERQLRVASGGSSRLSFGSFGRRGGRAGKGVSLGELVGREGRCC